MRADGARKRPEARLVHRRAVRSAKRPRGPRRSTQDARRHVRRRLASGAGVVQRRAGPRAARHEALAAATTSGRCRPIPRYLPRETRDYVPMILAAVIIAREPGAVRLRRCPSRDVGRRPRTVTVAGPVDLRRVAEWTGDAGRRHPAAQSGAAPLDDAGARAGLRAEGAAGQRRCAARAAGRGRRRPSAAP